MTNCNPFIYLCPPFFSFSYFSFLHGLDALIYFSSLKIISPICPPKGKCSLRLEINLCRWIQLQQLVVGFQSNMRKHIVIHSPYAKICRQQNETFKKNENITTEDYSIQSEKSSKNLPKQRAFDMSQIEHHTLSSVPSGGWRVYGPLLIILPQN